MFIASRFSKRCIDLFQGTGSFNVRKHGITDTGTRERHNTIGVGPRQLIEMLK